MIRLKKSVRRYRVRPETDRAYALSDEQKEIQMDAQDIVDALALDTRHPVYRNMEWCDNIDRLSKVYTTFNDMLNGLYTSRANEQLVATVIMLERRITLLEGGLK